MWTTQGFFYFQKTLCLKNYKMSWIYDKEGCFQLLYLNVEVRSFNEIRDVLSICTKVNFLQLSKVDYVEDSGSIFTIF